MKTGIGLYVHNSVEAVKLYQAAFDLELGYHVLNPDGSYFHSELYRDGREVLSVIESANPRTDSKTVQINFELDSEKEVQRAFALLCEGGTVDIPIGPLPWSPCAASVVDRYGVWWYISACSHYPPEDYDPHTPWEPGMYTKPPEE